MVEKKAHYCKTCGEFFQPTPDEERLIAMRHVEEVCLKCAMEQADNTETEWIPEPLRIPEGKYDGTKLWRAEKFDKAGKLLCFIARPPRPLKSRHESLRKPRKHILHVGIMGDSSRGQLASQPRVVMHTNVETFLDARKDLWISKIPGFWDPHSGVSRIEIPYQDVSEIVNGEQEKKIILKDGGVIRLVYK